ncbi:MAG: hypothetical protein AAGB93_10205 [Planctomycetota bacterium]
MPLYLLPRAVSLLPRAVADERDPQQPAERRHHVRGGRLARPQHERAIGGGQDGVSDTSIGEVGASCGRLAITERSGARLGFDAPEVPGPAVATIVAPKTAPSVVRALARPRPAGRPGMRTMPCGTVQVPRVASSARTGRSPMESTAGASVRVVTTTAFVRRVDRIRAVTAAASYVFVAAAIACTFLV